MQDSRIEIYLVAAAWAVAFISLIVTLVHWYRKRPSLKVDISKIPLPEIGPFDGHAVACTCKEHCETHQVIPESVVVGSNFTKVPMSKVPKVQVAVYSVDQFGKLIRYLGVGTRVLDWLVVPYHVVVADEVVGVLTSGEKPVALKLKTDKFELIDGDLAAIKLSEAEFSRLGLYRAGIASIEGEMMVAVCSASKEPEMSFGILTNDSKVFGGVVFRGSTRGGFSGSAYMVGKQIAGVHLGGGVMNYGVSASFVVALLQKPEDTAEWLSMVRRKSGKIKYQRSKFNPDEAIVFIDGRYHTVDLDLLEGDEEEQRADVYMPAREPEINLSENFPPQYMDIARPTVDAVNNVVNELRSKNLEMAERELSADQAAEHMKRYNELMGQLDEKFMLLQSMQDSVSNRYREVQRLVVEIPKEDKEARATLVAENEKLKSELIEIKKLKTDVNVETSLVKAVPQAVKKAKAKAASATIFEKMAGCGFKVEDVVRALVESGQVVRVDAPVGSVETTIAKAEGK